MDSSKKAELLKGFILPLMPGSTFSNISEKAIKKELLFIMMAEVVEKFLLRLVKIKLL